MISVSSEVSFFSFKQGGAMFLAIRMKLGLLAVAAVLVAAFAWSGAEGQFRPPRQPMNPPGFNPGMRPPGGIGGMNPPGGIGGMNPPGGVGGMRPPGGMGGGRMGIGWSCPKCGHTGEGAIAPKTCPSCGVTFINGIGNGSAGGLMGNPRGGPPMNGGFNPPMNGGGPPMNGGFHPPMMNPPAFAPDAPPAFNPPPSGFVPNGDPSSSNIGNPSNNPSQSSPRTGVVIALVVGVILVGVTLLAAGGAFLVYYIVRNNNSSS
jgi:hypothetical protein